MSYLSTYARTLRTNQQPLPAAGSTAPYTSLEQAFQAAHQARMVAVQQGDADVAWLWSNHLNNLRTYTAR